MSSCASAGSRAVGAASDMVGSLQPVKSVADAALMPAALPLTQSADSAQLDSRPRLPRPRTPGGLGASAPPLELLPGTSQARQAVDAQEAAPTELPGIEEPADPDEADSGALQELMVPRGVAHEDNLLRFDPVPRQNELDLPGLPSPGS